MKRILALTLCLTAHLPAQTATPPERLTVKEGFQVELLYSVPKSKQGSWITLCEDGQGRLITSDQYGKLYRFTPPAAGATLQESDIQAIDLDIGHAWGMCWLKGSLYVVVNDNAHGGRGLYRIDDTDQNDQYDKVTLLKKFEENGGEHGPHAVIPAPDGNSLYIACGNQTALPADYQDSLPPRVWGEDQLLPSAYGRGFMKGVEAPRGWVARTTLDGSHWQIIATGFRNQYDIDFNRDGELFTYDADMEWDLNTPWYRPTRINHVLRGGEFGWRNGSAKWPAYYLDSFGAAVDIGPGSPTGVVFGYGAKFPAKYQNAFFAADWSYGKLYAVHLSPEGASYTAEFEEFIAGQPLPLTDLIVASDGALYFAVGGRRVQSGLYRVTYTGSEATAALPDSPHEKDQEARATRAALEAHYKKSGPEAIELAWPHLASDDRALQFAARTAIEHQDLALWADRALAEKNPKASIIALMALARHGKENHQQAAFEALARIDYAELDQLYKLNYLRAHHLIFIRLGQANEAQKKSLAERLSPHYPATTQAENNELSQTLAYLGAPDVVAKTVDRLEKAPTQEEQIALAKNIRLVTTGWTPELRQRYFQWFLRAANYKGGAAFGKFIENIKADAVARLSEAEKQALAEILNAKPAEKSPVASAPRDFVKNWTMADLKPLLASGLEGGRDFANGRAMFSAAACFSCHRFDQEGGTIGPDLTSASGKFSPHDLLESIIEPSKEISDQYGSMVFTMNDGSTVIGRIANLNGDTYNVITDLFAPGDMKGINSTQIKSVEPNPVSMMPPGLLNTLKDEDILDLLAYILSAGDKKDPLFQK
ncbi:MAG: c-type cytochrome [Verrucomicrobiales bacterium]